MDEKAEMKGLLTLSEDILCKKDVLGKEFEIEIGGVKANLFFPQYPIVDASDPKIGINNPLLPPEIGSSWKRGEEQLSWGYPLMWPSGESSVCLLALFVECTQEQVSNCADILYRSIVKWEHAFIDYLKLKTKQGVIRDKSISRNTCTFELLEEKYIPRNQSICLYLTVPDSQSFATEDDIMSAIVFANSEKELFLEYQMLLSSYEARRNNQNRLAILDACSAMELSLVEQINNYCHSKGLPPEILQNKYRYLGEKIDLLKKINIGLPNLDYKTMIIMPRNDVMHNKAVFPSDEVTDKLISCVEAYLEYFHISYY